MLSRQQPFSPAAHCSCAALQTLLTACPKIADLCGFKVCPAGVDGSPEIAKLATSITSANAGLLEGSEGSSAAPHTSVSIVCGQIEQIDALPEEQVCLSWQCKLFCCWRPCAGGLHVKCVPNHQTSLPLLQVDVLVSEWMVSPAC